MQEPELSPIPGSGRTGKSINHVSRACSNCQRGHVGCDNVRPCSRCVRTGRQDSCVDGEQRKRGWRKGRSRNPAPGPGMDAAGDALSVSPFGIISPPQATSPRSHRGPADPLLSQFHGGGHGRDATMLAAHAVMSLQKGSGLAPTSPGGMSSSTSAVAGSSSSSRPASPSLTQPSGQVYHLQRLLSEGAAPPFGTAPMSPTGAAPPAQQQQFGRQPTNPMSFGKLHHLDVILPPLGPHSSTNYSPPSPLPTISSSSRESLSSLSSSPRDTLGMSHSRESLNMSSHSREALNMSHSRESLSLSLSRESLNLSLSRESLPSLSREGLPLTPREGLPLTPRGSISSASGGACPVPDAPPPPPFSLRLSLTNNNVVLACDGGLTQSTGYYTEDVLGSNLSDILHPADVPLMMRVLEFAQRVPDDPFTTVLRMRRRMGVDASPSYGWFEVVGRLEINPVTSRPLAVLISARALQLAVTHGTNDEFAMRHGMQGGCIEVSPSVQNVLGHDPERLRQSDIFAITHPTDGVFVQVALHRLLSGQSKDCKLRVRLRAIDDTYKWFEAEARVMSAPFGNEPSWLSCNFKLISDDRLQSDDVPAISCSSGRMMAT